MGMDMNQLPLILKHKRGKLDVRNLAVELATNNEMSVPLGCLEIKRLGWFVDIAINKFEVGAELAASLYIFGKTFHVGGSILAKVAGTQISLAILGKVEIKGGLNPFQLIFGDKFKCSLFVLDKAYLAADLTIDLKADVGGNISVGYEGKYYGLSISGFLAVKTLCINIHNLRTH